MIFSHWWNDHRQEASSSPPPRTKGRRPGACPTPLVTLYFDKDKVLTVAVLSKRVESLTVYFQCRVEQGTAYQRSPLYFELEGFIRSNWGKIRRQNGFEPQAVTVAMGALEASDDAHRKRIQAEQVAYRLKLHPPPSVQGDAEPHSDQPSLEEVLDIVRLHRLAEDLDILSVYLMRRTSKAFGRVAVRIAQTKLQQAHLVITALVDGTALSGYSNFARDDASSLENHLESGRTVEYRRCPAVHLVPNGPPGTLVPDGPADFSWSCQELALASLHRWWGDIVIRDYVGHKLILSWQCDHPVSSSTDPSKTLMGADKSGLLVVNNAIPLTAVCLEASPTVGVHTWPMSLASAQVEVHESHTTMATHDVTMSYSGRATIQQVQVDFRCLVRASARLALTELRQRYALIEESRPLLENELDYLHEVEEAAVLLL